MATTGDSQSGVDAGWRRRPWAPLLVFLVAWPVGVSCFLVSVLLSLGGSGGHTDRGSRSILAETLAVLTMVLAGLLPAYGVRLARRSLVRRTSVVGWLGLGSNAAALVFVGVVVVLNALELLDVIRARTR